MKYKYLLRDSKGEVHTATEGDEVTQYLLAYLRQHPGYKVDVYTQEDEYDSLMESFVEDEEGNHVGESEGINLYKTQGEYHYTISVSTKVNYTIE